MSDRTYRAVERAIAAHVADEADGAVATLWVFAAAGVAPGDPVTQTRYVYAEADAPWHSVLGLHEMQHRSLVRRLDEDRD